MSKSRESLDSIGRCIDAAYLIVFILSRSLTSSRVQSSSKPPPPENSLHALTMRTRIASVGSSATDVAPWSDDAQRALMDGKLDAFERGTPASDMAAELHKLDKFRFYYYPAWHAPSVPFALSINLEKWNALPSHLQVIISTAARWLDYQRLIDRTAPNGAALASLVQEHAVQVKQFLESVLKVLARVSDQILRERASQDELSQEILDSIMQFRQQAITWSMVSHQPFLKTRGSTS